jgi:hypothetical protein
MGSPKKSSMPSQTRHQSRHEHQPAWVPPRCPCGKVLTLDKADAKRWRRLYAEHTGIHNPVKYYQCRYGVYHWTSQTEWKEAS